MTPDREDEQTTETRPEGDLDPEAQHDGTEPEPLGPFTPDDDSAAGDSPDVHSTIAARDLPQGHPGKAEARRLEGENCEGSRGNVGT
jgi:hypothetical protein